MKSITVTELKQRLENNAPLTLIDCREEAEYKYCRIGNAVSLPVSQFEGRYTEIIKPDDAVVVYCHLGLSSLLCCQYLEKRGFKDCAHLTGGINAWAIKIDSKVPVY
ncbi:MAG: rhodanese [Deltaproteobacteria bacterium]|nr:rhodanese [Deltaproteobacteria bacterium]